VFQKESQATGIVPSFAAKIIQARFFLKHNFFDDGIAFDNHLCFDESTDLAEEILGGQSDEFSVEPLSLNPPVYFSFIL
jgi:hypothetical protein